jgi:alpha-beta hydrolase superfamily lysophospholipase
VTAEGWRPDVLGEGWEARTLDLRPDGQGGAAVATLVRRTGRAGDPPSRGVVLHVHGYVDYVFHAHLGDALAAAGWAYRGLDLRDHGRSIRPGRLPNYTDELGTHTEELDRAVRLLREEGHERVVVLGHSTGGLLVSLWAHHRRDRPDGAPADALVLNSPWFDLNRGWWDRVVTTRLNRALARVAPRAVVGNLGEAYGQWLHDPEGGGWEYDQRWKPDGGFGARSAWLASVRRAHDAVAAGLEVPTPVLVCTSDASGPADRMHPAIDRTDSVLDVAHMWERAPRLGADVTVVRIPGGVHDLALSRPGPREHFVRSITDWLDRRLP